MEGVKSTKIKVLIVDDSALVRQVLEQGLSKDPDLEVVGTAGDPFEARDKLLKLRPHVMTLDVEMPKMSGVEFLKRLIPQYPIPVVMVSALTERGKKITLDALSAGAVDFVSKPTSNVAQGLGQLIGQLATKVKLASRAKVKQGRKAGGKAVSYEVIRSKMPDSWMTDQIIAIGASTGGTEALRRVINRLPKNSPATVIVQHMPATFTKMFADSLNEKSEMSVKEAVDGDKLVQGQVLVAPGDFHLEIIKAALGYRVKLSSGEKVSGHRPSVDVMMKSIAKNVKSNISGAMLTGMGRDGADGMLAMRKMGAETLAQDEASSVVFGMPREAFANGGAQTLVPIDEIAETLVTLYSEKP